MTADQRSTETATSERRRCPRAETARLQRWPGRRAARRGAVHGIAWSLAIEALAGVLGWFAYLAGRRWGWW